MSTIQFIAIYLLAVNIITWLVFGIDKHKAINHEFRIPEAVLFLLSLIGGSIGALIGMFGFHHKTRKWKFRIFIPLILIVEIGMLAFLCQHYNIIIR